MIFIAKVQDGIISLPQGVHWPDGTRVIVKPCTTLADRLAPYIGVVNDAPTDLAVNHDHYLYGAPKREA